MLVARTMPLVSNIPLCPWFKDSLLARAMRDGHTLKRSERQLHYFVLSFTQLLSLRVMSPYEIENQFEDYSSKYFGEFTRSIIYSQPPVMIPMPKDLVRVRRPFTRVRALVRQSLPCLALPCLSTGSSHQAHQVRRWGSTLLTQLTTFKWVMMAVKSTDKAQVTPSIISCQRDLLRVQ